MRGIKKFARIWVLIFVCSIVAGCGSKGKTSSANEETQATLADVKPIEYTRPYEIETSTEAKDKEKPQETVAEEKATAEGKEAETESESEKEDAVAYTDEKQDSSRVEGNAETPTEAPPVIPEVKEEIPVIAPPAPQSQPKPAEVVSADTVTVKEISSEGLKLLSFSSFTESEKSQAQSIAGNIVNGSMSEYEKVKIIHDYLVDTIIYKTDMSGNGNSPEYHAEGAFAGSAVCQGYADAFNLLCYYSGIQSECVSSDSMCHAWNQVRIDGNWYNIDVTWDDPVGSDQVRIYNYFLLSDSEMGQSHYGERYSEQHSCGSTYNGSAGNNRLTLAFFASYLFGDYTSIIITSVDEVAEVYSPYATAGTKVVIAYTSDTPLVPQDIANVVFSLNGSVTIMGSYLTMGPDEYYFLIVE